MSEEKQIEELAKFCCFPCDFDYYGGCVEGVNPCKCGIAIETAKKIYTQGYRKRVEGEWIRHESMPLSRQCGNCKGWYTKISINEYDYQFCPHCGARMDGE